MLTEGVRWHGWVMEYGAGSCQTSGTSCSEPISHLAAQGPICQHRKCVREKAHKTGQVHLQAARHVLPSRPSGTELGVQELCESRGGRPGLSVLMSLTVSVDVKQYRTMLRHWSQFVPNLSTDIRGHEALHHHQEQNSHRKSWNVLRSELPRVAGNGQQATWTSATRPSTTRLMRRTSGQDVWPAVRPPLTLAHVLLVWPVLGVTCLGRGNSGQVVFTHESPFALSFNDTREFESGDAHGDRFREGAWSGPSWPGVA